MPLVHCVGEVLWDLCAPAGVSLAAARSLRLVPGGAALNTAHGLVREGVAASLCAELGDDPLGRALSERAREMEVQTDRVRFVRAPTPLFFLGRAASGAREIVAYRSPAGERPVLPPPGARAVHVASMAAHPDALGDLVRLARRARRERARLTLDLNARPRVFRGAPDPLPAIAKVLAAADVVKASDEDLRVLLPGADEAAALAWLRRAMRRDAVLVVTRGAGRVSALGPFGEVSRAPRAIADLDATGAGDAFTAALVADVVRARSAPGTADVWRERLARASRAARAAMRRRSG